jgi:hypothetical protein
MTFSIISLSYRSLQQVLACPENTVKRNSRGDVLRAEVQRLLSEGVLTLAQLEVLPTSAPKVTRFDWLGLATDRKDAIQTLKVLRATGFRFETEFKLNSTNALLRDALTEFANSAPEVNIEPVVQPVVQQPKKARKAPKAQTITALPTVTVKPTKAPKAAKPEPTQLERERAATEHLLAERTRLEIHLALSPECEYTRELLEECCEDLHAMPARSFC